MRPWQTLAQRILAQRILVRQTLARQTLARQTLAQRLTRFYYISIFVFGAYGAYEPYGEGASQGPSDSGGP
ncbi:MAG: hypothetical protein AAGA46_12880 [Cyanobacteria bacterium P01_F01_bin.13]